MPTRATRTRVNTNQRGIAGRAQTSRPAVAGAAARQQMREAAARRAYNIKRRKSNGGQGG